MTEPTLFPDLQPVETVAGETLSAGRRLTLRQKADVDRGVHPLRRTRTDPDPAHTCGSCIHRELYQHHNRTYPKCDVGPVAHSTQTDVRAWWPGCTDWKAQP